MKRNITPRGYRNNNPLNIRISSDLFQGEVRPSRDKSFKQFETMAYGYRAAFRILRNYYNRYSLKTIRQIINRWAPSSENDTEAYITHVSDYSGIPADATINIYSEQQMCAIVAGMSLMENGRTPDLADILTGWSML